MFSLLFFLVLFSTEMVKRREGDREVKNYPAKGEERSLCVCDSISTCNSIQLVFYCALQAGGGSALTGRVNEWTCRR